MGAFGDGVLGAYFEKATMRRDLNDQQKSTHTCQTNHIVELDVIAR